MSNEELINMIREGTADRQQLLADLWQQNLPIIHKVVWRFCKPADYDDGMQESFLCLTSAADHWQSDSGGNFLTYYTKCLQRWLVRTILCNAAAVTMPEGVQKQAARLRKAENSFLAEHGAYPSNVQLAEILQIAVEEVQALKSAALSLETKSVDEFVPGSDDLTFADVLEDEKAEFEARIISDQAAGELLEAIKKELLPEEQNLILQRAEGKTFQEMGEDIGETGERARRLYLKAARKMRRSPYCYTSLPYHGGFRSFMYSGSSVVELAVLERFGER